MPSGTADTAVTNITSVVPTHAERIPADSARREGNEVKNSHDKRGAPSITICINKAMNVRSAIIKARIPAIRKIKSQRLCRAIITRNLSSFFASFINTADKSDFGFILDGLAWL